MFPPENPYYSPLRLGYSSCEVFTAMMKDNAVATVFGEDTTTGGAGATVLAHTGMVSAVDPKISLLELRRQNGKLIEDFGVEVDYLVRPSVGDVIPGGQNLRQLSMIADVLRQKAAASR